MVTKRSEAALKQLHTIEEYDTEPVWHEANGFIGYDDYILQARNARAKEVNRMMQLAGTSIKRLFKHFFALVDKKPCVKTNTQAMQ